MTQKISIIERVKKLRVFSYFRELSVVIIGVLITLAITDRINTNTKRSEIREALSLVKMELWNNLEILEEVSTYYEEDIKLLGLFRDNLENIRAIPAESILENPNVFGRMFEFTPTKDAYEVLKSSVLMPYIKDKTLLLDLMKCYSQMDKVANAVALYVDLKIESAHNSLDIDPSLLYQLSNWMEQGDPYPYFETMLRSNEVRIFLRSAPNVFDDDIFGALKQTMEIMIERIDKGY